VTIPALPAASMVIIDDRPDLHVLVGRRRPGHFVGGMIVYPGGAVDADDWLLGPQRCPGVSAPDLTDAEAAGYLHAAIRESREEVGLWPEPAAGLDGGHFRAVGHWITPEDAPRRYDTRFFLARHPGGEARVADDELVEVWWERPAATLERLDRGELDAIAPTISFLTALSRYRHVEDAFAGTERGILREFEWGVTTF
jgi:8-oxo-dGTP pyrophosphatase MutT (NUDIX family)